MFGLELFRSFSMAVPFSNPLSFSLAAMADHDKLINSFS